MLLKTRNAGHRGAIEHLVDDGEELELSDASGPYLGDSRSRVEQTPGVHQAKVS